VEVAKEKLDYFYSHGDQYIWDTLPPISDNVLKKTFKSVVLYDDDAEIIERKKITLDSLLAGSDKSDDKTKYDDYDDYDEDDKSSSDVTLKSMAILESKIKPGDWIDDTLTGKLSGRYRRLAAAATGTDEKLLTACTLADKTKFNKDYDKWRDAIQESTMRCSICMTDPPMYNILKKGVDYFVCNKSVKCKGRLKQVCFRMFHKTCVKNDAIYLSYDTESYDETWICPMCNHSKTSKLVEASDKKKRRETRKRRGKTHEKGRRRRRKGKSKGIKRRKKETKGSNSRPKR